MRKIHSYAMGKWRAGNDDGSPLHNAVTGELIGYVTSSGLDFKAMRDYAKSNAGKKLRSMTFHERGRMLKALALHLFDNKDKFYALSYATGATKVDSWIDIEGGINNLFSYASKGRRDFSDETFYVEGQLEKLSKSGSFMGHHICVPLEGVAVHINAFNFPCWGMLEKIAPTLLAGVPTIVKPASKTCYLTELMVQEIIKSGILPEGSLQLICGSTGDLLDHLDGQDVVTFTGSASTGRMLKKKDSIINESVRFNMEADSLNMSILGEDASPETDEFGLFVKELVREMTVKAGQKCTAIRRAIVPEQYVEDVINAVNARLAKNLIGDPQVEGVRMGPLAGQEQVKEVASQVEKLKSEAELVSIYNRDNLEIRGGDKDKGAFYPATLLYCDSPFSKTAVHSVEAFGPVSTIMPYKNRDEAIELAKLGKGSLVGSLFTADNEAAREIVRATASHHGRLLVIDSDSAKESTGHGSPLPQLVHGGPGRAGGGEELGGTRGVLHYMQRTAIQGHPNVISAITNIWQKGADKHEDPVHPFRKHYDELHIGDSLETARRTVTETDIVNFANISGDNFYAHMDMTSIADSIFEGRVAHGYFIISAAAGLFVDPKQGPILANYGLDELRFTQPVYVGDTIYVHLTVKEKIDKEAKADMKPQGVIKWDVEVLNQHDEIVAQATILTLVAKKSI